MCGPGPGHGDEEGVEAAGGGDLEVSADAGHAVQLGVVPAPQRRQLATAAFTTRQRQKTHSSVIRLLNNKYSVLWMEPALRERSEVKAGCS